MRRRTLTKSQRLISWSLFTISLIVSILSLSATNVYAEAPSLKGSILASNPDITFHDPLAPCHGDCSITIFGGHSAAPMSMQDVLMNVTLPTEWDWGNSDIAGIYFSRPIMSYKDLFTIDTEVGIAKRFGAETETEYWTALYLRWRKFPWNHIVKTTIGASIGVNYATGVSIYEKDKAITRGSEGSRLLHFFSPELTLALPEHDNVELVFRFHHRSGVWGTFNGVHGGSHFGTVGLRFKF